eukprot:TRINITY_DN17495_c0_g1_i2.p2 TRINITY_DN17495_c0_g1~~TRINITY_DN17495_c0_g1_i2.p2  ORF type:complete len:115 (+),score=45.86 TRINITY_DN17495_c0_g1_i2:9-353(+)
MIRRPPRSTLDRSSAASDVYKRQGINAEYMGILQFMDTAIKLLKEATDWTIKNPQKTKLALIYAGILILLSLIIIGLKWIFAPKIEESASQQKKKKAKKAKEEAKKEEKKSREI